MEIFFFSPQPPPRLEMEILKTTLSHLKSILGDRQYLLLILLNVVSLNAH